MCSEFEISRVHYDAASYRHPATGALELRLVRKGSSPAWIDLGAGPRRVFTRPGDLLFSLGDQPTAFSIEDGRELTVIKIPSPLAAELLRDAGGAIEELSALADRPLRDPLLAALCRRLEELAPERLALRRWALALTLGLMLDVARTRSASVRPPLLTEKRLRKVQAHIDENLGGPLRLDTLGALVAMPRRAFTAAFKNATGLPVYQFVLRRRTDRATQWLRETDLPLVEVAALAGFSHQAHMTRVLRRLTGRTPAQIRAQGGVA